MGYRERVTDTHLPQIAELPKVLPDLLQAPLRAKAAGFDGVELHYAHAYTMSSMLSRLNTRDDGYGGALENRLRLPLEVFSAVREAVGDDYTVGCRYLADDIIDGGNTVEDACRIGFAFADAGMNFYRCRAAAGSKMRSNHLSVPQPIPIPDRAATNARPGFFPTNRARSAVTSNQPPGYAATSVRRP